MSTQRKQTSGKKLTRRKILSYGLYGGLTASLSPGLWLSGCSRQDHAKRPNVILISIDTLRADHLGCYGYDRPTSPAIDEFASHSMLFEDAMATSPWTLPSHASLLAGLYPNRHGLKSWNNLPTLNIKMLAAILKEHGFSTSAVVNSYCLSGRYGLNLGFDDFVYVKELLAQRTPSKVNDEALRWLRRRSEPFFLFLHYYDVHSDYRSLPRYEEQFVRPYKGTANGTTRQLLNFRMGRVEFDGAAADHLIDLYDASIRQMDDAVTRLLEFLKNEKLLEKSVVIVTSDHGEEFLDHGGVLHSQTQYQELLDIPLIMCGPGIPKGKRSGNTVSLVDVMPTILSLLGIAVPASLDGLDLCPLFQEDNPVLAPRYIFAGASKVTSPAKRIKYHDIKRAVRYSRYKLHYDKLTRETLLYDLLHDPKERINIVSAHRPLVNLMLVRLRSYMDVDRTRAPLPPLSPKQIRKLRSLGYIN